MANGDLHLLGTLYTGGIKRLMPTNPVNGGNITPYVAGQLIEIRNTDVNDAYKLRWREVTTESGTILISDRNILHSISWSDLDLQGLISGIEVSIDGQQYRLRILTGGSDFRVPGDIYAGGTPIVNEWDQIIVNESNIIGLPKPVAADLTSQNTIGAHNKFWNWSGMYSLMKEIFAGYVSNRVIRGHGATSVFQSNLSTTRGVNTGYRPVLEILKASPDIFVNINHAQRKAESTHVKVAGEWRKVDALYSKINGIWRK